MGPRLIFDIETIGVELSSLDPKSREFLLSNCESEEEKRLVKEELGFSPLTGEIIAVGVLNPDTSKGAVYYHELNSKQKEEDDGEARYVPCKDEKEVLNQFWDVAVHYDQFISFNGHAFDIPFLMVRSAVLKIKPSQNLTQNRYRPNLHLDLYDALTNYGAFRSGKRNLHMWCTAFSIKSPKGEGISGNDVAKLFKNKECLKIAKYCFGDIKATAELYDHWEKYLK